MPDQNCNFLPPFPASADAHHVVGTPPPLPLSGDSGALVRRKLGPSQFAPVCPNCDARLQVRSSRKVVDGYRELYCLCVNCGGGYKFAIYFVANLREPMLTRQGDLFADLNADCAIIARAVETSGGASIA